MHSKAVNAQEEAAEDRASPAVADVVVSCVPNTTGAESPATPMEVAMATHSATSVGICGLKEPEQKPRNLQEQLQDERQTSSEVTHVQNEQRRERHWRRMVHSELRDRLVAAMYVRCGMIVPVNRLDEKSIEFLVYGWCV